MSKQLATWQRLAIDRALVLEMATVELEAAQEACDMSKIVIAETYQRDALNLHAAAQRRVRELSQVAA